MSDLAQDLEQDAFDTLTRLERELTDGERRELENELYLRAAALGWTGPPLIQPASSILAAWRAVEDRRKGVRSHAE